MHLQKKKKNFSVKKKKTFHHTIHGYGDLSAHPKRKLHVATVLNRRANDAQAYLLGLLAKIKCSICSYQLNLWYVAHGVT